MLKPKVILALSCINVLLGYCYSLSDGPWIELEERIVSGRELVSSGSDDWHYIVGAMYFFAIPSAVSLAVILVPGWHRGAGRIYIGVFWFYALWIFLASLDTSLSFSISHGDWLLGLCLGVPLLGLGAALFPSAKNQPNV